MVDLAPGTIAAIVAVGAAAGFGLGFDSSPEPPPPEIKREVKWIEKPSLEPQVVTRKEYVTEYITLDLPESCSKVAVDSARLARVTGNTAEAFSNLYAFTKDYQVMEGVRTDLIQTMFDTRKKAEAAVYELMWATDAQEARVNQCKQDLDNLQDEAD